MKTKCQSKKAECKACNNKCTSVMAHHRETGLLGLDQVRHEHVFRAGQDIPFIRNGRPGFYCVREGYARLNHRLRKQYYAVRIVGKGDLLGFVNCVADSYSATALDEVHACYFDIEILFMLMEKSPSLSYEMIKSLCETVVARDDRIVALSSRSAISRVAATLHSLGKKFGQKNPDGSIDIVPAIDRGTLAELSGMAIETFSRITTELEEKNILLRNRRALRIMDNLALVHQIEE